MSPANPQGRPGLEEKNSHAGGGFLGGGSLSLREPEREAGEPSSARRGSASHQVVVSPDSRQLLEGEGSKGSIWRGAGSSGKVTPCPATHGGSHLPGSIRDHRRPAAWVPLQRVPAAWAHPSRERRGPSVLPHIHTPAASPAALQIAFTQS